MNRTRVFMVLALAVMAGGGLAYATYSYIQNVPVQTVSIPTRPVVVAARDLPLGTELGPDNLRVIQWPANAAPANAIGDPGEIKGRGLVMPVIENEPILPLKMASVEAGSGLPPVIPSGLRAVSVHVNEVIGVAGYVLPGTRVDVVATASPTDSRGDITSKVVLTNVVVLASGTKIDTSGDRSEAQPVTVVTLLVTPEEAERLTLASTEGKIQLALRNPLDESAPVTPGVRPAGLFGAPPRTTQARVSAARRNPAAPVETAQVIAPPVLTVEMIRGDKRVEEVIR